VGSLATREEPRIAWDWSGAARGGAVRPAWRSDRPRRRDRRDRRRAGGARRRDARRAPDPEEPGRASGSSASHAWPESKPPTVNATAADAAPERPRSERAVHAYAFLFAAAAGIGLIVGYLLDLTHVAWSAAAAMFIMRPEPGLLASRAVGRVSTFAGVVAAGLILRRGPAEIVVALLVVAAIGSMVAVRTSRWYVAPAGSG